jgi:hypothetical protein
MGEFLLGWVAHELEEAGPVHGGSTMLDPEGEDAEYLALAHLLDCRLVTLDARLRRGAARLGFVVTPLEL